MEWAQPKFANSKANPLEGFRFSLSKPICLIKISNEHERCLKTKANRMYCFLHALLTRSQCQRTAMPNAQKQKYVIQPRVHASSLLDRSAIQPRRKERSSAQYVLLVLRAPSTHLCLCILIASPALGVRGDVQLRLFLNG